MVEKTEIKTEILKIVKTVSNTILDEESIDDVNLIEDLYLSSISFVYLIVELESFFNITITWGRLNLDMTMIFQ